MYTVEKSMLPEAAKMKSSGVIFGTCTIMGTVAVTIEVVLRCGHGHGHGCGNDSSRVRDRSGGRGHHEEDEAID